MTTDTERFSLVLHGGRDAPALARRQVCARLDGDAGCREVLQLLLSEAVTNAVRHGGRRQDGAGEVVVEVERRGEQVEIRVLDGGEGVPRRRPSGPGGGFGLHMVDQLAQAWGADRGCLWFRLPLH